MTTTQNRPVVLSTEEEITNIKLRLYYLEKDSAYQGKQILLLLKNDSIKNVAIKSLAANFTALNKVYKSDSIFQWRAIYSATALIPQVASLKKDSIAQWLKINSVTPLIPKVSSLTVRHEKDSTKQWGSINKLLPLLGLPLRFQSDSTFQWRAIRQLQGAAPVTQIPVMQGQITTLFKQSKTLQTNLNDSVLSVKSFINNISVFVDTSQFSKSGNTLRITALPEILQNLVSIKKDITELQTNQGPIRNQ